MYLYLILTIYNIYSFHNQLKLTSKVILNKTNLKFILAVVGANNILNASVFSFFDNYMIYWAPNLEHKIKNFSMHFFIYFKYKHFIEYK